MPFVRTWRLEELSMGDAPDFPAILKPTDGSASRGVRVVFTRDELEPFRGRPERFIVQEYLTPVDWGIQTSHLRPADVHKNGALRQEGEVGRNVLISPTGTTLGSHLCSFELRQGVLYQSRLFEEHPAK